MNNEEIINTFEAANGYKFEVEKRTASDKTESFVIKKNGTPLTYRNGNGRACLVKFGTFAAANIEFAKITGAL